MAITEIYVDPAINADSGNGTIGTPYGDLQYALDQANHPASGGSRINIKAGTDEVLTAALDLDTGGTGYLETNDTTWANFLIFQGYTSAANDGGIGGISGDGLYAIMDGLDTYIVFRDLHCRNVGNNQILDISGNATTINCEFNGSTSTGSIVDLGANSLAIGCLFHDMNGTALDIGNGHVHRNRFIDSGASNHFITTMQFGSASSATDNIIWLDTAAANGIKYQTGCYINGNSIFQNAAGTGKGIYERVSSNSNTHIANNLVEGFSGAGGIGIQMAPSGQGSVYGNAIYDCTTDIANTSNVIVEWDNESLGASPFTDGANKDFSPVDTGGVKEGSQPSTIGLFTY